MWDEERIIPILSFIASPFLMSVFSGLVLFCFVSRALGLAPMFLKPSCLILWSLGTLALTKHVNFPALPDPTYFC